MKFFRLRDGKRHALIYGRDGGPQSTVEGWWLIEFKSLFSIVLLKFNSGSRLAYHSHAFNAWSWYLKGNTTEITLNGNGEKERTNYWKGFHWKPKFTPRSQMHKVVSKGTSWVLSVRGPWNETWQEYLPDTKEFVTLTHGRKRVT